MLNSGRWTKSTNPVIVRGITLLTEVKRQSEHSIKCTISSTFKAAQHSKLLKIKAQNTLLGRMETYRLAKLILDYKPLGKMENRKT
jgi:hypothetical protein